MLEIKNIRKTYEDKLLLKGVSFQVSRGETVCLLGASGSGKSTLLRIIAGLEQAEGGQVLWNSESLDGIPVHKRNFGLMFQDYALFPHRSVAENVGFGLRMKGMAKNEIDQQVSDALKQVNMASFGNRLVTDLSGGEQQRVALARALAPRPRLLMLDEPLGALDRGLRADLSDELRHLLRKTEIPAIYVTHDQEEAFAIADRLVLLHQGLVEQEGTPTEVYERPVSPWTARFLGMTNLLPGKVISTQPLRVITEIGTWKITNSPCDNLEEGQNVSVIIRQFVNSLAYTGDSDNFIEGIVEDISFRGNGYRVDLRCAHQYLQFYFQQPFTIGQRLSFFVPPETVYCLATKSTEV